MTKKEKLIKVLSDLPDEVINPAYSLNLATEEMYAQMDFNPKLLRFLGVEQVEVEGNGYIGFLIDSGGVKFRITMT